MLIKLSTNKPFMKLNVWINEASNAYRNIRVAESGLLMNHAWDIAIIAKECGSFLEQLFFRKDVISLPRLWFSYIHMNSNCPYDSNEIFTVILRHIRVLYVQWHQTRMTDLRKNIQKLIPVFFDNDDVVSKVWKIPIFKVTRLERLKSAPYLTLDLTKKTCHCNSRAHFDKMRRLKTWSRILIVWETFFRIVDSESAV